MMYSNCNLPLSLIKNYSTVKAFNSNSHSASCSTLVVNPVCLILTQYATKCKLKLGDTLIYCIYVINNTKNSVTNIKLKDTLPKEVKLIRTFVEDGYYNYNNNSILYKIRNIKPHSFCKITIVLRPTTLGKKINSIEVICKKSKCTLNNPCEICSIVKLNTNEDL
ncbi:DUF11 domain-containing protein [Clostridium felsineum]|uniref:DUF11 domain-containing protein n=1 Tax=Clostridium felsineum TaxID=36839 RepID=A0A1S8KXI6_9CLOT|nr:DUF11 domain-containing protein [Clostridium felsineum]MCR3760182.1 DUF11 domain-containing protein [Clostridium felsineum]URZ05576.1 hypothetical protein CLROS_009020 [Clostridium felsineum]URZ10615.1 hypothetical protein CROST_013250 [Clostridium felsineum]URZ17471.1 hypothetical protein CLFE_035240 [Clostridium felsineum DSM 794]